MILGALARLLSLAAMVIVGLMFGRLIRGLSRSQQKGGAPRSGRQPTTPVAGEPMVRDRVCNTFLPRAKAIVLDHDGENHYFCSESCRSRFLGSVAAGKSA